MTATEERKALINAAAELQADLQKFTSRVNMLINKLLGEADLLKIAAADEHNNAETVKVTKVKFSKSSMAGIGEPETGRPLDQIAGKLGKGKRACSICREPGHRATTCPQADAKYKADRKGKK